MRQQRVEEVNSGEGDAYYVEFCQKAARLLYHRVLEKMEGLADKIHISCFAARMRRFVAHRAG